MGLEKERGGILSRKRRRCVNGIGSTSDAMIRMRLDEPGDLFSGLVCGQILACRGRPVPVGGSGEVSATNGCIVDCHFARWNG